MDTTEFLDYFYENAYGQFEITAISPPELDLKPHIMTVSRPSFREFDLTKLHELNQRGYGIYYGLTTKRAAPAPGMRSKESNSMFLYMLWADLDGVEDKATMIECLTDHSQPPSVIVDSGGGLHALWKLASPVLITESNHDAIKETIRGIAISWQGDPSVAETARVFRLPGFDNTKTKRNGAPCFVRVFQDRTYRLADFSHYRRLVKKTPAVDRDFKPITHNDIPQYAQDYINTAHSEGTRNTTLNITAWRLHTDGYTESQALQWLMPRALADDPTAEKAIRATIASAFKAARGTPSYISPRNKKRMAGNDASL